MATEVSMRVSKEVRDKLDELRHPGQTYDGVLREILEELERCRQRSSESK